MSDTASQFQVTVPAGNGLATTTLFKTPLGISVVRHITLMFPAGCAGNVGAVIMAANSPAYPRAAGSFLIFDGYPYEQDVQNQINTGDWAILAYNTDFLPHTLQVVYQWDTLIPGPTLSTSSLISA